MAHNYVANFSYKGRDVWGRNPNIGDEGTHFGTATRGVEETLGFLQLDSPPHGIVSSRGIYFTYIMISLVYL